MGLGFLQPHREKLYAVMRIVVGFMFLCHGLQKCFGLLGQPPGEMPAAMRWFAGLLELIGGGMMMVGFFTGIAAFLCSGMMAVGYFMVHQKMGALPIQNHGELAAAYAFVFLYIAARGSGTWSVDAARGAKTG